MIWKKYIIELDGDTWFCTDETFEDLMVSKYAYSKNPQRALLLFMYFVEKIDTLIEPILKDDEGYECQQA